MDKLHIRLALPGERLKLEELQRRASLALETYREQLEANPDAIDLPPNRSSAAMSWLPKWMAGLPVSRRS